MAGVAEGSPRNNVSIDTDGYLHLKITSTAGKWTASELFHHRQSRVRHLPIGRWIAPIDRFDQNVVLGLFEPTAPRQAPSEKDSTNEIDIEYCVLGAADGTRRRLDRLPRVKARPSASSPCTFSLNGGTLSTSRGVHLERELPIEDFLMTGLQHSRHSTTELVKSWTYPPTDPTVNIHQQPLPSA